VIITGSLTISGSGTTSLTVQKQSSFNNTASFNSPINVGGARFETIKSTTTTDTTQTNIWSYVMADGEAISIEALVIGVSSSSSGGNTSTYSVGGNLVGLCRNGTLGSNTTGQSSSSFDNFSGSPTFGITTDGVGGSNAYVWVQGLASTTIEWEVSIRWNALRSGTGGA
jgi:hypothetical protein